MKDYSVTVLYSGSKGNATLIRAGKDAILIDAGHSCRSLCRSLEEAGVSPSELCAVFLTHEHKDHTAALDVFTKKYALPVHAPRAAAEHLQKTAGPALALALVPHATCFTERIGAFLITSFPTAHDSHASVGYRIEIAGTQGTHCIGFATDLGTVTSEVRQGLLGCETVVLESNYDEEMLRDGPYPQELKRRIASGHGHLSNENCAAFAAELAKSGTTRFILAHISENNNLPALAYGEVCAALGGYGVEVLTAAQDAAVGF